MIEEIEKALNYKINFDVVKRVIGKYHLFFLSSLVDNENVNTICKGIIENSAYFHSGNINEHIKFNDAIVMVFSGAVLVTDEEKIYTIECRSYPSRSIQEPEGERTIRGAHDGFNESLITNIALIRRRIRSSNFFCELIKVGNNDVSINYLNDKVNQLLLYKIKKEIQNLKNTELPLGSKSLVKQIYKPKYAMFPQVRYTERPDIATIYLNKGFIVILLDCSSSAIIVPTNFFNINEQIEEYQLNNVIATANKIFRYLCMFIGLYLLPLWLLLNYQQESFISFFVLVKDIPYRRLCFEIISVQVFLNAIRLASYNTPSSLSTSMSIVSTIVLSNVVISINLVSEEVIFYCALSSICIFTLSNYETSKAISIWNLILIFATLLFNKLGFIIVNTIFFILLVSINNFGYYYLEPIIPLKIKKHIRID